MYNLPVDYTKLNPSGKRLVREQYIKKQKGLCYHCKHSLEVQAPDSITTIHVTESLFPPGFFNNPIHLHHCHRTNMTLGAVHCHCNAVLWEHYGE